MRRCQVISTVAAMLATLTATPAAADDLTGIPLSFLYDSSPNNFNNMRYAVIVIQEPGKPNFSIVSALTNVGQPNLFTQHFRAAMQAAINTKEVITVTNVLKTHTPPGTPLVYPDGNYYVWARGGVRIGGYTWGAPNTGF